MSWQWLKRVSGRLVRGTLLCLCCVLAVASGLLWVRSFSHTDIVQMTCMKSGHSIGSQEWSLETYQGGLLMEIRSIVYEARETDSPVSSGTTFQWNTAPQAFTAHDAGAKKSFWGRCGLIGSTYSDVVRAEPVVTVFGQRAGIPFWLLIGLFGLWPLLRAWRPLRLWVAARQAAQGKREGMQTDLPSQNALMAEGFR